MIVSRSVSEVREGGGTRVLRGVAASSGIGIGKAVLILQPELPVNHRDTGEFAVELRRFERAADVFCTQIAALAARAAEEFGESEAGILTSQIVIMQDREIFRRVSACLREHSLRAEGAVVRVFDEYIAHFSALEDALMRARAADFRDMKRRLLTILTEAECQPPQPPAGCVLVADEIPPSVAAFLLPQQVAAVATVDGDVTSHVAILARALKIPTVVSAPSILDRIQNGDELIVDGGTGEVIVCPTAEQVGRYRRRHHQQQLAREHRQALCSASPATRDGRQVLLTAELAELSRLPDLLELGADGVGLFRTTALYRDGDLPPGEQQQFLAYRAITRALRGKPGTICTLDVGDSLDKPYLGLDQEPNPSLGLRAVRYSLVNQELFKVQLSAILRASAFGTLQIAVPMVTSLGELRQVRLLLEECKQELAARQVDYDPSIKLGLVISTPAAAITAATLARETDFFLLGGSLTQYTLAVDRNNRGVSGLYSNFHPAVLALIYQVIQAAAMAYIPVGMLGEGARDPMLIPFLVGCGINELCVPLSCLLPVREQLGNLSHRYWQERVPEILSCATPEEAMAYIKQNWAERTQFGM